MLVAYNRGGAGGFGSVRALVAGVLIGLQVVAGFFTARSSVRARVSSLPPRRAAGARPVRPELSARHGPRREWFGPVALIARLWRWWRPARARGRPFELRMMTVILTRSSAMGGTSSVATGPDVDRAWAVLGLRAYTSTLLGLGSDSIRGSGMITSGGVAAVLGVLLGIHLPDGALFRDQTVVTGNRLPAIHGLGVVPGARSPASDREASGGCSSTATRQPITTSPSECWSA